MSKISKMNRSKFLLIFLSIGFLISTGFYIQKQISPRIESIRYETTINYDLRNRSQRYESLIRYQLKIQYKAEYNPELISLTNFSLSTQTFEYSEDWELNNTDAELIKTDFPITSSRYYIYRISGDFWNNLISSPMSFTLDIYFGYIGIGLSGSLNLVEPLTDIYPDISHYSEPEFVNEIPELVSKPDWLKLMASFIIGITGLLCLQLPKHEGKLVISFGKKLDDINQKHLESEKKK